MLTGATSTPTPSRRGARFRPTLHDEKVDFACGNGYKWLHADFGCAPFYVRREHLDWMTADRHGHRQVAESLAGNRFRLKTSAEKLEYGSPAYGPVAAMDAALAFVGEVGLDRIAAHTHALAGELREDAAALGMRMFTPRRRIRHPSSASTTGSITNG